MVQGAVRFMPGARQNRHVIPAKAGIHLFSRTAAAARRRIPALAGLTL